MLLKITQKCSMGYTHCLENATANGRHMNMETFEKVLNFFIRSNPIVILVTGGEPTDNPNFFTMMERLISVFGKERLLITTNGLFLYDTSFTERVLSLGVSIQVTNDIRYYPMSINLNVENKLISYETHIRSLYPQGRALVNGYKAINKTAPNCFNLRSISCNNANTFSEAVKILEMKGHFCTPSIDIDGGIHVGESSLCHVIGTVDSDDSTLLNNIRSMKCNKCKMEDNLSFMHKKAINSI